MQRGVRRFRDQMDNCRQQTVEVHDVTFQDTPRKKSKTNKKVELEETTEIRATTLVMNTDEWTSEVHAIIALSTDHPSLKIVPKRGLARTLIRAKDQATEDTLLQMTELQNKSISFRPQTPKTTAIGIVQRVPVAVPMALLLTTQVILSAVRMTRWDRKEKAAAPTMSVKILYERTLPISIQIGYLGTFYVRQDTPDPIRCYRCQKYGHTSKKSKLVA